MTALTFKSPPNIASELAISPPHHNNNLFLCDKQVFSTQVRFYVSVVHKYLVHISM